MRALRIIRRFILLLVVVLVIAAVVALAWLLTHRDQARAWRQVIVVAGELSDLGATDGIADALGSDTDPARSKTAGNLPATLVTPSGTPRRHPAIVLFIPDGTTEVEERRVRESQHALGAAGLSAWAVRVPSRDDALVDPAMLETIIGALEAVARDSTTANGRVSVLATGATASLVLVAVPKLADRVTIPGIVAVQPVADVRGLVALAATGSFQDAGGNVRVGTPDPELRASAGRAVLRAIRSELTIRGPVVEGVLDAAERADDPLGALEVLPDAAAGPELRPLLDVLRAETLAEFDAAWDALPERFRDVALEHSPMLVADRIDARVVVVEASDDPWGSADARRLADALPRARHLQLDAADPGNVLDDPDRVRDLVDVSEWWMRASGRS